MSERLDRIESLVEQNAQAIAQSREERKELREYFRATLGAISEMSSQVSEMQSEVRGLQVENRRILDRVFGDDS